MNSQPDQDEVKFAKALVNPDKSIRDKTLATFRKYLASQASFEHMEMLKLWKALYYCMWLADKQPVQLELAQRLCDMVDTFQTQQLSLLFIRMFFRIMMREWPYLDQYRVNKFYTLVRLMFRKALSMAHEASWSSDLTSALLNIIDEEALTKTPNGIRFHLADIFLSELHNVTSGDINTKDFLVALKPFQDSLLRLEDNAVFIERIAKEVFIKYTTQFAAENAATASEEEEEGQDKKTMFGKVNTRVLQKLLFDTAAAEETPSPCRKRLYDLHKQFAVCTGASFVSESVEAMLAQEGGKAAATPAGKKDKASKAATPAPAPVPAAAPAETKSKSAKKEGKSKDKDAAAAEQTQAQAVTPAAKKQVKVQEKEEKQEKAPKSEKKGKRPHSEVEEEEAPAATTAAAPVSAKKEKKEKAAAVSTPATKDPSTSTSTSTSSKKAAKTSESSSPASATTSSTTTAPAAEAAAPPQFIPSAKFAGRKPGYMFQKGKSGMGYYWDKVAEARGKGRGCTPGKPSNSSGGNNGKGSSSAVKAKLAATPGSSKKKKAVEYF